MNFHVFSAPKFLPVHPVLISQRGFASLLPDYDVYVKMHFFFLLLNFFFGNIFKDWRKLNLITFSFCHVFLSSPTKPPSPNDPFIAPDVSRILSHLKTTKAKELNLILIPHLLHFPSFSDLPLACTTYEGNVYFILSMSSRRFVRLPSQTNVPFCHPILPSAAPERPAPIATHCVSTPPIHQPLTTHTHHRPNTDTTISRFLGWVFEAALINLPTN